MDDDVITEIFAGLGPVSIRKMFGGKGVYHDGVIVGIEVRGDVLLKADKMPAPEFETAGGKRWTYDGKRKAGLHAVLDDPGSRDRRSR